MQTRKEKFLEWDGNVAAPTDGETQMAPLQLSPKRNKTLKTDRETLLSRERTRSKTRYKTIQSISCAVLVTTTLIMPIMFQTYKIATLIINVISSNARVQMLEDFLWRQDVEFALLQEVSHTTLNTIR
jgi:hypothetical protein